MEQFVVKQAAAQVASRVETALAPMDTVTAVAGLPDSKTVATAVENVIVDQSTRALQHQSSGPLASEAKTLEQKDKIILSESEHAIPPAPPREATLDQGVESAPKATSGSPRANAITISRADPKAITENKLNPRDQEKQDEQVLRGVRCLFNNKFMNAKAIFEQKADSDPLHALALSSMAFLKAVMTSSESDTATAIESLNATYNLATTQLNASKRSSSLSEYLPTNFLKSDSRSNPTNQFPPNGVLRAHVIKAECCLLIAILQLLQESVMGYVKCGVNLQRSYKSYNFVWQKFKDMNENYNAFMDHDTVAGVQFGIGSIHLVLSALPAKILKAISFLGWKPDRQLGLKLLSTCIESKRIRSPLASVILLSFYSVNTSFAPQILTDAYTKVAMETLLESQRHYPNSALYLYFAGRFARTALDLPLSTQSFLYAIEMAKKDWAEIAVTHACRYEIALNHIITGNWGQAASVFEYLCNEKYWSPAFCKYLQGACLDMAGNRTEAILAYAQVPGLVIKKSGGKMSDTDEFALHKVTLFQASGYQDLDFYLPALEFACIWNLFSYMGDAVIASCQAAVEKALDNIQLREQQEYDARSQELAPETPLPDHFNERAIALLVKAAVQNVSGHNSGNSVILNWIVDHKDNEKLEPWVVPYALWEAGVTCWKTNRQDRSRHIWEMSLSHAKYNFEHRMAVRLNLAISYAEELGYTNPVAEPIDAKNRYSISLPSLMTSSS